MEVKIGDLVMLVSDDIVFFFFFKQKTAYEIVSRDWSSDVCSSDLNAIFRWDFQKYSVKILYTIIDGVCMGIPEIMHCGILRHQQLINHRIVHQIWYLLQQTCSALRFYMDLVYNR